MNGQSYGVVNVTSDTYVDVGNPMQGADHVRFRDVVICMIKSDTSNCLSRRWIAKPRGNDAEVHLHNQRIDEDDEEKDVTPKGEPTDSEQTAWRKLTRIDQHLLEAQRGSTAQWSRSQALQRLSGY